MKSLISSKTESIGARLDRYKGVGPGFDVLRVGLALGILVFHSFAFYYGMQGVDTSASTLVLRHLFIPMFFALSGFLVTSSAQRLRLQDFLLNRTLRVAPALAVDVLISALIIGPLFTVLPLRNYFSDAKFTGYLLNIVGFMHYFLPGVFTTNPLPNWVNSSLWTVPYELGGYILISVLIGAGFINSRTKTLWAITVFTIVFFCVNIYFLSHEALITDDGVPWHVFIRSFTASGLNMVYLNVACGIFIYVWRYKIPFSPLWAVLALLFVALKEYEIIPPNPFGPLMTAFAIGYLTVFFGLLPIKKMPLFSRGDYSYGIYLYACPIQQMLATFMPGHAPFVVYIATAIVVVTATAMLSWHCVEKPMLGLRKRFSFTARKGDAHPELPR